MPASTADGKSAKFSALRRQAAELIGRPEKAGASLPSCVDKGIDILDLITELDVYQAELEIQNQELQEANENLDVLFREYTDLYDNAPCGYVTLNAEGCITKINEAASRILGMTRKQNVPEPLSPFLHPQYHGPYHDALSRAGQQGAVQHVVLRLSDTRASASWIRIDAVSKRNQAKEVEAWRLSLTDITELKNAEAELRKAKRLADEANKAKSLFLANMSHEIRTPLNGIMGMLQLVQMASNDQERDECADHGIESCKRLTCLIGDILDLSKVESGRLEIQSTPFNIHDLLHSLETLFRDVVKQKELALFVNIAPGLPQDFLGDPFRIQQVLSNLLGNALKFTESGSVTLEATYLDSQHHDRKCVLFSVADTGNGIPDDKLLNLFEPFVQASEGLTKRHQGAGLGLAISKKLVSLMGGSMCVVSEEGVGSTFHVCLPLTPAEFTAQGDSVSSSIDAAGQCRHLKVLLAEDETSNQIVGVKLIEVQGHDVTLVENGERVLEEMRHDAFDCILMDIQMPVMDGVETTRAIRSDYEFRKQASIPIIALTAYAMADDRDKFIAAGMDDYLAKPLDAASLNVVLGKVAKKLY